MIRVSVHPLFWPLIAAGLLAGRIGELLLLFALVLAHELAHAVAAEACGYRVERIVLLPFGGALIAEPPPLLTARVEAIVAAAGPLMNAALLVAGAVLERAAGESAGGFPPGTLQAWQAGNGALLSVNLLPFFPLDGGRLLQAGLSRLVPYRRSLVGSYALTLLGGGALLFALIGLRQAGWAVATASFWTVVAYAVWESGQAWRALPLTMAAFWLRRTLHAEAIRRFPVRIVAVDGPLTPDGAVGRLFRERYHRFVCRGRPETGGRLRCPGPSPVSAVEERAASVGAGSVQAPDEFRFIACLVRGEDVCRGGCNGSSGAL
ncbi:site-2 protease family protein [Hydrogenibacillus schlegelii]|uniref:Peptidase M50 domain-containing protein n=1 Tax=Hydrogenibacillus schlegelii TaxID=1484 RepID=A0A179IQ19_HYDSH|nr:site-2 protease family protein [Hydrogenibacillus schlegelii]MBT9282805.1 hypothetical protein [Hydrogenibacillus schlegelii]OAR03711.1 hypothetical protein SA87_00555 [Hydrogenibacillus schlegelii]